VTGVGSALLEWLTGGSALAALGKLSIAVCALVLGLVYRRYLGILGADPKEPFEWDVYTALRDSLTKGNLAARLYAERLTKLLDWIDRLSGDAETADHTLFPRAFGLKTPAPLWTVPAFDRCLLLGFVYPIAMIFIIWFVSGNIGPAEQALHLKTKPSEWQIRLAAAGAVLCLFTVSWPNFRRRWGPLVYTSTTIIWMLIAEPLVACFLVFVGFWSGIIPTSFAARSRVIATMTARFRALATVPRFQGVFLALFSLAMMLTCFFAANSLSQSAIWDQVGPMLLFLGLITVLNAPFDWASLGLTRALLRRGLELGRWWPYALALVDAALAAVIISALAFTMVVGVQAFDALAVHGGGDRVLPLDALFKGIKANPSAPEYWWVYGLLLSTMIPSLVNLVIGGTSLVRGLPGVPSLLLQKIPERGNVPKFDRAWIATVLTAQVVAGTALGIAAQVFLVWVIIGHVMPFFGLELLDMARGVAAFNLPARVGLLFGVSL
jgi:hypothetical protein